MPDNITPNYVKVNPDGTITGEFSGGVLLNTETVSDAYPPPQENSIQWQRDPNTGGLVAFHLAYAPTANSSVFRHTVVDPTNAASSAENFIGVSDPNGLEQAGIEIDTIKGGYGHGAGSDTIVNVLYAQNSRKRLYRASDSSSGFLQLPNPTTGVISWGVVKFDGTAITAGSGDWTSVRNSIGSYSLTWTTKVHNTPAVVANLIEDGVGAGVRLTSFPGFNGVNLSCITPTGAGDDNSFCFVAIG